MTYIYNQSIALCYVVCNASRRETGKSHEFALRIRDFVLIQVRKRKIVPRESLKGRQAALRVIARKYYFGGVYYKKSLVCTELRQLARSAGGDASGNRDQLSSSSGVSWYSSLSRCTRTRTTVASDCWRSRGGRFGGALFSGLGSVTRMLTSRPIGSGTGSRACGVALRRRLPQRRLKASLMSR